MYLFIHQNNSQLYILGKKLPNYNDYSSVINNTPFLATFTEIHSFFFFKSKPLAIYMAVWTFFLNFIKALKLPNNIRHDLLDIDL